MKGIVRFSRLVFVVLSFAVLLLAGCSGGSDSTPTGTFTAGQVAGKTFAYSSADSTGTLAFNADGTWSTTIASSTFSGTWSITDGKLVCVTTSGGNHTLTYTALVSDDSKAIHASVVEVNPSDPANPATYTATLTALYTIAGKISQADTGFAGVTVALDGDQTLTAATDADGNYQFTVPAGEYRITPSNGSTTFTPLDKSFPVTNTNVTSVDFIESTSKTAPYTNRWLITGSLIYPRERHTATLLQNGRVLVAGGKYKILVNYLRGSAEIYNPDNGKWEQTDSLNHMRYGHTATLLQNGKVLVVGGHSATGTTTTSEIYDPSTGKWTLTGSLKYDRSEHTATLLPNGKVLVTGGQDNISTGGTSEIYDPATGKWTLTGSLNYKRFDHTATLLQNGNVLVAGGLDDDGNSRASAELYDPATGTWTQTGSMNYKRAYHTATLLQNGKVLVVGGKGNLNESKSTEIYDPTTGIWTVAGSLYWNSPYNHTATLLQNGKVIIDGGQNNDYAACEIYDPNTDTWSPQAASSNYTRYDHTATLLDFGVVLVVGGYWSGMENRSSAELYFP